MRIGISCSIIILRSAIHLSYTFWSLIPQKLGLMLSLAAAAGSSLKILLLYHNVSVWSFILNLIFAIQFFLGSVDARNAVAGTYSWLCVLWITILAICRCSWGSLDSFLISGLLPLVIDNEFLMKLLILIALPTGVGGYILLRSNVGDNFLRNRIQPMAFLVTNMQYLIILSDCIRMHPRRVRNTVDCCFGFRYNMGYSPRLSFLDELQVLIGIEVLSVLELGVLPR